MAVQPESRVGQIVDHLIRLRDKGNRWPLVKEILVCLPRNKRPTTSSRIAGLLRRVRRELGDEHHIPVCSLSSRAYEAVHDPKKKVLRQPFLIEPPESEEEAKQCLPGSARGEIAGLYFPKVRGNDPIYAAWERKYAKQGIGVTLLFLQAAKDAIEQGVLSPATFKQLGSMLQKTISTQRQLEPPK